MVFSSLVFLYGLFPLSLIAYHFCPSSRVQNVILLIFSLIFYAWGGPQFVLLLMFMALTSWVCALGVDRAKNQKRKRLWLIGAAVIDIGLIGYFKYAGLICSIFGEVPEFVQNILLPIGISFYTFQLLTYVVDVYRGDAQVQRSYWNVLLYAALFHQCIAGPIVRYKTIDQELFSGQKRKGELAEGVSRFSFGLAKKVLLANPCGALAESLILWESAASDVSAAAVTLRGLPVLGSWVGVIAYGMQIYLDFSAYSDMAIGMGQMLGLHYLENFNYPYISRSITEFWRRWHMSLGTFFRDYVYIPLGGSRRGFWRGIFNAFVVWTLTGLWHGASWNFLLWGLWFFVFLMLERLVLKKTLAKIPVLSNLYTLIVVLLGWVLFCYSDLELVWTLVRSLFGANGNGFSDWFLELELQGSMYLLLVSAVACTPLTKIVCTRLGRLAHSHGGWGKVWDILYYSLLPVLFLLLSTAALVGDSYNPFIYFQF